jgi:excisionase family DNA binding protein
MPGEWLSLSEAADILGVHPSTVRSWANRGDFPVHRTEGGHRRFRRADLELWMQSQKDDRPFEPASVSQSVLRRTRMHISEGHLESEAWYSKLDDEARKQYRLSGRALLQGLITHLNSEGEDGMEAEARSLGYEYASRGRTYGLSSVEATHAFLFFRNTFLESMLNEFESSGIRSPQVWADMYQKINAFTDQILITLLETYEAYQRGNRY